MGQYAKAPKNYEHYSRTHQFVETHGEDTNRRKRYRALKCLAITTMPSSSQGCSLSRVFALSTSFSPFSRSAKPPLVATLPSSPYVSDFRSVQVGCS